MWPSEQSGGGLMRVEYDALSQAAAEERALRNELIRVQDERRAAVLPPAALGRILPSEELLAAVARADEVTRRRLWDQAHRCQDLHETLRAFRNDVRRLDEDVADRFEALRGGAGMSGVVPTGTRMESIALLGGLPAEVQAVVRPLVQPLLEQWDSLVGDHEAVHEAAQRWRAMGRHVDDLGRRQHRTVEDTEPGWVGLAQRGWASAAGEVGTGLAVLADRSLDVGDCLDEAASAVRETERLVRELVRELVEWAALTLAVSAVTGLVTLGASTLAGAATAAARAAVTGSRIAVLIGRLAAVLRRIQDRVDAYRAWVQGLSTVRRVVVERAEKQVVSVVVKKPLRGEIADATGVDGQPLEPLESLVDARRREHEVPTG